MLQNFELGVNGLYTKLGRLGYYSW